MLNVCLTACGGALNPYPDQATLEQACLVHMDSVNDLHPTNPHQMQYINGIEIWTWSDSEIVFALNQDGSCNMVTFAL